MLIAAQAAVAAIVAAAYLARVHAMRRSPEAPPRWRVLCFCAGIATAIAAVATLEGPGRELVYLATLQQLLIGDLATLLIALGLTAPLLRPLGGVPLLSRLRVLALPAVALVLWTVDTAVWRLPAPYEAALDHRSLMLVQHLLSAAVGIAVWVALIGPGAVERWAERHGLWLGCALFWRALLVALGIVGIVSPIVFYSHYIHTDVSHTISPLSDQGIAGSILIGESAIAAIGLLLLIYFRLGEGSSAGKRPPGPSAADASTQRVANAA